MTKIINTETARTRRGLVLEGGAMRGLFTAGVLDVFMENGLLFDGAVGVSAGAAFGCNVKSGQIGRALRYNLNYCRDRRYVSLRSWLRTGDLYNAEFDYVTLPEQLDVFDADAFRASPMEFWVVCTDADTGETVWHRLQEGGREDLQWVRASASLPVLSRPVQLGGRRLWDGGVSDSIPLRRFESMGYGRCVVVLTQPASYVKTQPRILPLARFLLRRYPAVVARLNDRPARYNETIGYVRSEECAGRALVIRPSAPLAVGTSEHDPEKLRRVYEAGRLAAGQRLGEVREFLSRPS